MTTFKIERTFEASFLYAKVADNDPDPLAIEVSARSVDDLAHLQELGDDLQDVELGATYRVTGKVSLENEGEFWEIANHILTVGRKYGLKGKTNE